VVSQKNNSDNFWSGYALGILSGGALMYGFGTKKGREAVKKIMEHTDTLEHNIEDILNLIQNKLPSLDEKDKS